MCEKTMLFITDAEAELLERLVTIAVCENELTEGDFKNAVKILNKLYGEQEK